MQDLPEAPAGRFRPFAESSMEARISADGAGAILHVNKRTESMFGYAADELIGRPLTMLMPERFRAAHQRALERARGAARRGYVGQTMELTALRRDGEEFPVELALASWGSGDDVFFFGNLRDVTERKRAEDERLRLLAELREVSAARERLLEDVAHELRGPLTSLGLTIGMYQDLEPQQLSDLMVRAERAVSHLQRLVDDMLDARSIHEGSFHVAPEPVAWNDLATAAVEAMQPLLDNAGQRVECLPAPTRLRVMADRPHAVRAIVNLLSNASKYSRHGEAIGLAADVEGNQLRITVTDRGPGISPENQGRLFERFYRADAGRQRPGVGLGLAIVKGVAEAHGGAVGVASQPGEGSSFWLTLPLA